MDESSAAPDAGKTRQTPIGCLIAVILVFVVGVYFLFQVETPAERGIGKPLPALDLIPLTGDGQAVTLEQLNGKVVLVNFWATRCGPCLMELPHMQQLQEQIRDDDFVLLAVSCGEEDLASLRRNTQDLLDREGLDLPTYADPDRTTQNAFQEAASVTGFPTSFVLDRSGVIREVWVGYGPGLEKEMRATVEELLAEQPEMKP